MTTPDPTLTADVAIVGGGAAGLATAIALARSLRRVVVIDAGSPRNRTSAHAHNVLGHEGINPLDLVAKGRKEAEGYGVTFIDAAVTGAQSTPAEVARPHRFTLDTSAGVQVSAQHVVIATGITDELPDIPGLAERWGDTVLHCPYCHGYEVRGQSIGIIGTTALSYHQAMMFSQLSDRVTFIRHAAPEPTAEQAAMLDALGITLVDAQVEAVHRTEAGTEVTLRSVASDDTTSALAASTITLEALVVGPFFRANGEVFTQLGGTVVEDPSGMGSSITADPTGRTDIPGVWAVGNVADMSAMLGASAASGVRAGAMINYELIQSALAG
ncbi:MULTISPECIES: NAD(P)/FAD-dependent oxidoreductase [unclassified Brevibacterium]|uniref:NAD(P)/FAD-dependent oxidoreductase n=1 Tax=unclassified Brevibacterium TaxID=2614124 RepID=UPI0036254C42